MPKRYRVVSTPSGLECLCEEVLQLPKNPYCNSEYEAWVSYEVIQIAAVRECKEKLAAAEALLTSIRKKAQTLYSQL
jgi:hypothetical protein